MQLSLKLDIPPLQRPISYTDRLLLVGSCFTEHIYDRLHQHRFRVLANPHGILFNPLSVAGSLVSYIDDRQYAPGDLFQLNELWNSWDHHTRFSHINIDEALAAINQSQAEASAFIRQADWLIITLGSAFQYYLKENGRPVANNHRAPAQWFEKKLLPVPEIIDALHGAMEKLFAINPFVQVIFTISPVRHLRDGVIDNNRSKARLIEAVHDLCCRWEQLHYFPAYELVIDVLRDYRFYDIDFAHPNYLATSYVWEQFVTACIQPQAQEIMKQVHEIVTARAHRPRFPETAAHRKFLESYAQKTRVLMGKYPFLDMAGEVTFFEGEG